MACCYIRHDIKISFIHLGRVEVGNNITRVVTFCIISFKAVSELQRLDSCVLDFSWNGQGRG